MAAAAAVTDNKAASGAAEARAAAAEARADALQQQLDAAQAAAQAAGSAHGQLLQRAEAAEAKQQVGALSSCWFHDAHHCCHQSSSTSTHSMCEIWHDFDDAAMMLASVFQS